MTHICAQPSTFYYAWQVDAMLLSFQRVGINLETVHIVSVTHSGIDPHFRKIEHKWSKLGVIFTYYEDTRGGFDYISSVRPHILEKHWKAFPHLENQNIFYHDCDIALTKSIDNLENMLSDDIVYLSDTVSYIGAKYIESKGHGIFEQMCEIVGIDKDLVRSREADSGGAQYILKPGITAEFWAKVYKDSEQLFKQITDKNSTLRSDDYHELQIWCADMWAVLWNLWLEGYETKIVPELDFSWGTSTHDLWNKYAIYHNAGVTTEQSGQPFYKALYMNGKSPINAPRPSNKWASQRYYDLMVQSWNETMEF